MIQIYCENIQRNVECEAGTTLSTLLKINNIRLKWPVLAAIVDNQLKELSFPVYISHQIKFIDYSDPDGQRCYNRSLIFVLQKVIADLYPQYSLVIDYNMQNGMYGELRELIPYEDGTPRTVALGEDEIDNIRKGMQRIINADLPFTREKIRTQDAVRIFREHHKPEKAVLHELRGKFFTTVYYLDGYPDHFYGPLTERTGMLSCFNFESFSRGFLLNVPQITSPYEIKKAPYQYKLFDVFKEHSEWCSILGVKGVGPLNDAILKGRTRDLIQISEGLHERKYAAMADEISQRRGDIKLVLIAGPSSSGKTTTSKRVSLQCKVLGLNPVVIEMDNYFVDRDKTPRDENGEFDFESLNALDVTFLTEQLNQLFEGEAIKIPKFDFARGTRVFTGESMIMGEKDILIMEGIHALNPKITEKLSPEKYYRIYASALTSLSLDENNNISTSDSRLIRRIVRDGNFRGVSTEETILRWPSVRRGEIRNIFPYQENADIMFNSALIYELPALKYYAEPLLRRILPNSPASIESIRLLKFLSYVQALQPSEIDMIPPTSVMREFIGGSSFIY
jgi:uridine kinase